MLKLLCVFAGVFGRIRKGSCSNFVLGSPYVLEVAVALEYPGWVVLAVAVELLVPIPFGVNPSGLSIVEHHRRYTPASGTPPLEMEAGLL